MGCSKYIEWISAALDGELTADERRELDAHLAVCSECAALFEALSDQTRALRELDTDFPAGLHDRILNNLPAQHSPAKKNNVIRWKRWGSLAACLVLVTAVGVFGRFGFRMGSMAPAAAEMALEAPAGNTKADGGWDMESLESESKTSAPEAAPAEEGLSPVTFSKVHYLRATYRDDLAAPTATVISDADSLAAYLEQTLSPEFDTAVWEALNGYTADFFADRSLLLVLLVEGSGSVSHEILSVTGDRVTVRRTVPEVGTCDMAAWLLAVELDTALAANTALSVEFLK